jgi:hypothetical protein
MSLCDSSPGSGGVIIEHPELVSSARFGVVPAEDSPRWSAHGVAVVRNDPGDVELSVSLDSPDAGIIVFNEPLAEGWIAYVDDVEAAIRPVNNVLMAVNVSTGDHTVRFHHDIPTYPMPVRVRVLYILSALLITLLGAWSVQLVIFRRGKIGGVKNPDDLEMKE